MRRSSAAALNNFSTLPRSASSYFQDDPLLLNELPNNQSPLNKSLNQATPQTNSVVDDFNNIYNRKRGINIKLKSNGLKKYEIYGIENRIEQIIANLLDNSISFSKDNQKILVELLDSKKDKIIINVIDEEQGFKEKDTNKIFKRFYSNRPEKFGEHSGLGLNIVKNLIDLHGGTIKASNNANKRGAKVEIKFPKA